MHVLQFIYLGNNGFRFPFARYPTTEVDPSSLYTNFWKAVGWLRMIGFQVNYCCMDGGEANRSFIKMHSQGKDPEEEKFTTINPYTRKPIVFLLDPSVSKLQKIFHLYMQNTYYLILNSMRTGEGGLHTMYFYCIHFT